MCAQLPEPSLTKSGILAAKVDFVCTLLHLLCADKAWSILVHLYENSCPAFIICHLSFSFHSLARCPLSFSVTALLMEMYLPLACSVLGPALAAASCCCLTEKLQLLVRAVVVLFLSI